MARRHDSLPRLGLMAGLAGVAVMMGYVTLFWESSQPATLLRTLDGVAVDFSMQAPRSIEYDNTGRPVRIYSADELVHYRAGDRSELAQPVFEVIGDDGTVWRSNSREGTLVGADQLNLRGSVVVADATETTQLHTEALQWDAAGRQLTSTVAVRLIRHTHRVDGIGLRADLARDRIEVVKQVQAIHVIP